MASSSATSRRPVKGSVMLRPQGVVSPASDVVGCSCGAALRVALVVHDLGVDDVVVSAGRAGLGAVLLGPRLSTLGAPGGLLGGVHGLADLLAARGQRLGLGLELLGGGVLGQRLAQVGDGLLDLGAGVGRHLVLVVLEELLGRPRQLLGLVADLGLLAALAVLLGVQLGLTHHPLD